MILFIKPKITYLKSEAMNSTELRRFMWCSPYLFFQSLTSFQYFMHKGNRNFINNIAYL